MFFTPFAFVRQPYAVSIVSPISASFTGYYILGNFTTYATNTDPYFRMLDISGSISSSFNIGTGFDSNVNTAATQSDGKILVGGNFTIYSGSSSNGVIRLNTDGTKDTTFNPGTVGTNTSVYSIVVQSDGKVVTGGAFTSYSGSTKNRIVRINPNGTADTGSSWNQGTGFSSIVYSLAQQSDGKIVVGGNFTTYSGSGASRIIRLNPNGTADTGSSWNTGAGFNNTIYSVAVQADQKIIVLGPFTTYSGSSKNYITRLNTNGTTDTTFNIGTSFNSSINFSVAVQPDQKIIVGGNFSTYSGSGASRIVRINPNGTADTGSSWNTGTGFNAQLYNVAVQPDGKILAKGNFTGFSGSVVNGVARLNSNGTLDTTFNQTQSINSDSLPSVILPLSNGSIILGGYFIGNKVGYATFLNSIGDTTPRSSIASNGFNGNTAAALQVGSNIIIAGNFTSYSGSAVNRIVRLNASGTKDTSFSIGTGFNGAVSTLAVQADQKIVAGGSFTDYSGSSRSRIDRINTDGTADTALAFKVGLGFSSTVNSIIVQPDQKIVVGSNSTTYSGSTKNYIVRINTNGTADTGSSWNQGTGFNSQVYSLAQQSDGKIVVGGLFTAYSGSGAKNIARLNVSGTIDTGSTWNTGVGFGNAVNSVIVQPDQKIVVGGAFLTYSGSTKNYIARLNTDGTADTGSSWNQGTGFNNQVRAVLYESGSGKILVTGDFTTYAGSTANRIALLDPSGTLDTTFTPTGTGFNTTTVGALIIYDNF